MGVVLENGNVVEGANSFIDGDFLNSFMSFRGISIPADDVDKFLIISYDFMSLLPWCKSHESSFTVTESMKKAQCDIIKNLSEDFELYETPIDKNIKKLEEKIDVFTDKWEFFSSSLHSDNNPMDVLAKMPYAAASLKNLLCPNANSGGIYVV